MEEKTELRFYSLVLYSLMPMQKGIQTQHTTAEYTLKYNFDDVFVEWARNHKTTIVLDGGTSNSGNETRYGYPKQKGGLEILVDEFDSIGVRYSVFYEPDVNYSLTSIGMILPDQVFNTRKYPGFKSWLQERYGRDYKSYMYNSPETSEYDEWLDTLVNGYMTSKQVTELRKLVNPLPLAR